ncbi:Acidic mammalian chitinase [Microtus ochrogaster]|uniref:Acidic mammalian chitinase n=1 Tax=Microtus ochrogaster TaxID=79684 RepID=A0A8J6KQG4_MICOH|nr:Acidic mammalian chitinase [Microtus ochrogaster]
MCYYNNVAQDRPGLGSFSVGDIDPCLCSHLIYAFAKIQNNRITQGRNSDLTDYQTLRTLKNRSNELITLLAVGGSDTGTAPFLNYILVMTYNLHEYKEGYTGEISPLYKSPTDIDNDAFLNMDYIMKYWVKNGAAAEKLIAGFATYAQTFSLTDPSNIGIGAPTSSPGPEGPVASANNFGGAMIWALGMDDFSGSFCNQGKFPLTSTVKEVLKVTSASCMVSAPDLHLVNAPLDSGCRNEKNTTEPVDSLPSVTRE